MVSAFFSYCVIARIRAIRKVIASGRPLEPTHSRENTAKPWRDVLLLAFGQRKMFDRPVVGIFHFFLYAGFLLINIEVLEIIWDGLMGTHRSLLPIFGSFYAFFISGIEALVVLVLGACLVFLCRRSLWKVRRLRAPELKGWPALDAHLILLAEAFLMICILFMNAADQVLQTIYPERYPPTGRFFFSSFLIPLLEDRRLILLWLIERTAWWAHIIGIFAFALYITYSKHLHVIMAFPNIYYRHLSRMGRMDPLRSVTREVRSFMGMTPSDAEEKSTSDNFGASRVQDFTWKSLMDGYACTECGRCTEVCPAHITGKKLSPRRVVMKLRDASEECARGSSHTKQRRSGGADASLFDLITSEELNACTMCYACTEVCPVGIDPVAIIVQMRQFTAMETTHAPDAWQQMCGNVENNGAPWKFSAAQRMEWTKES